jgi:hypothetical protein
VEGRPNGKIYIIENFKMISPAGAGCIVYDEKNEKKMKKNEKF